MAENTDPGTVRNRSSFSDSPVISGRKAAMSASDKTLDRRMVILRRSQFASCREREVWACASPSYLPTTMRETPG